MLDFLRMEGISENLINEIDKFRKFYKLDMDMNYRIPNPKYYYFGNDVWEQAKELIERATPKEHAETSVEF